MLLAATLSLTAQNINQTVQVTNEYETKFEDFKRQTPELQLPDSLYRFDYDFDYSVFDSPYRGSYVFTPYRVEITPDAKEYDGKRLYLKAGAGYNLRPVLDLVYNPLLRDNAALSLYNFGGGCLTSSFYDFRDIAGLSGHWMIPACTVRWDMGYEGIFTGKAAPAAAYNSGFVKLKLNSADVGRSFFTYDMDLDARMGSQICPDGQILATDIVLGGSLGPVLSTTYSFLLDFNFDVKALRDGRPEYVGDVTNSATFLPHLVFSTGAFDIDLGARLDYVMSGTSSFLLAPAAKASFNIPAASMKLAASFTGGARLHSLYSLKSQNHFYLRSGDEPAFVREKYNAALAVSGAIANTFQYELKGGYASYVNSAVDSWLGLAFMDSRVAYAELGLDWKSEHFRSDATLRYQYVDLLQSTAGAYLPAEFTADFNFRYSYRNRLDAGLNLNASSARRCVDGSFEDVPYFVDLGLFGNYSFKHGWSAWAHLGNLLCGEIQRHPGLVEKGPYITLGFTLSIK